MPLILANTSGKRFPAGSRPKRVTLGRADDRIVGVFAPIHPGWVFVPLGSLAAGVPFACNGKPLDRPTRLRNGDRLTLGPNQLAVAESSSAEEPATTPPTVRVAQVIVRFRNQPPVEARIQKWAVIGTATAGIVVPPETGLAPQHAVVAHVEDRWYLFVLAQNGATRFGDGEPTYAMPLVGDESVWLSADVELTLRCDEIDPLDRIDSTSEVDIGAAVDASQASVGTASITVSEETPASLPGELLSRRPSSVGVAGSGWASVAAVELCDRLKATQDRVPPLPQPPLVEARAFPPSPDRVEGTVAAVEQLRLRVETAPWEPQSLFALAVYLQQLGMSERARWVLKQLHAQNPADPVVNESLGVLYRQRATDRTRPLHDRVSDLERANKHLRWATVERPDDTRLAEILRSVASQLAVTRPVRTGADSGETE